MKNIAPDKANKVLIISFNEIGDVITTTPLISSVRKIHPNAILVLLVKNEFIENIFGDSLPVDELYRVRQIYR